MLYDVDSFNALHRRSPNRHVSPGQLGMKGKSAQRYEGVHMIQGIKVVYEEEQAQKTSSVHL